VGVLLQLPFEPFCRIPTFEAVAEITGTTVLYGAALSPNVYASARNTFDISTDDKARV
jgi:hypothetical protein